MCHQSPNLRPHAAKEVGASYRATLPLRSCWRHGPSIIGIVELEKGNGSNYSTMLLLLKIGVAVVAACWGCLVVWTLTTLQTLTNLRRSSGYTTQVNRLGVTVSIEIRLSKTGGGDALEQ